MIMRSKTLLISNILATVYTGILLWWIGGGMIAAGGVEYIETLTQSFSILSSISSDVTMTVTIIYVIMILLIVHISLFTFGAFWGWISYLAKKSGMAKFAATLYLIGTICFPIYILFGLPITIIGYIGGGKQKKINISIN